MCALWRAEVSSGWHVSSAVRLIFEIMSFTGLEAAELGYRKTNGVAPQELSALFSETGSSIG